MVRLTLSVPTILALVACGGRASAPPPALTCFGQLPLSFVENQGQTDRRVRFQSSGPGHGFFLTADGIALTLTRPSGDGVNLAAVRGCVAGGPGGRRARPGRSTTSGRPRVHRRPGLLRGRLPRALAGHRHGAARQGGALKYEFRVHPGADRCDIELAYDGAYRPRRADGALLVDTALGALRERRRSPTRSRASRAGYAYGARVRVHTRRLRPGARARHRPGPRVLDLPRRHEPRDPAASRRRRRQRLRHRLHPVADFPTTSGAFDRTGAASNNLDVSCEAQPGRHGARLLDLHRRHELRLGPRHHGRHRRQRLRDRPDPVLELPDDVGRVRSLVSTSIPARGAGSISRTRSLLKLNAGGSSLVYSTFLGGFSSTTTSGSRWTLLATPS